MAQGFVLYGELSVRQNLNFVAGLFGLRFLKRRRRVREVLEFVELWEHRRKTAANTSGGMQRGLQLAAAIVHDPELLFIEEPTANFPRISSRCRFYSTLLGTPSLEVMRFLYFGNGTPIHFDHHYAEQTEFGKPLVDSTFTFALVTGQSVIDISQNVFANLGWDEVRQITHLTPDEG